MHYNLKARENPEPIFDVSECALKHVPSGIYSLCKVFRKKILMMYDNKLSSLSGGGALSDLSLLTVLDIHGNEFTTLPPDIMCLSSLKVYLLNCAESFIICSCILFYIKKGNIFYRIFLTIQNNILYCI